MQAMTEQEIEQEVDYVAAGGISINWLTPDYAAVFKERIERLERLRQSPDVLLPALKDFYKENPVAFIRDWGVTFDPRMAERGLPTTMPFILFPKQEEWINWMVVRWKNREDGLTEKSRDMGLSWLCVAFAVWMWLFHEGTVVGFGSRKEEYVDKLGDPKSLFWKVRQFINYLPQEFQPSGWNDQKHAPHMRILNPENESSIIGEAGDNIGRGNRTSVYFKDESAFYERPDAIDAALSQTSNCKIDISTPNGSGNPFYKKAHGGKIPKFIFDWRDDPRKDDDWYAAQCEKLEAHIVAQEIDRNYEASVINAFIDGATVDEAMRRGPASFSNTGRLRVGVDPARFGNDKFAVVVRRGRVVLKIVEAQKLDTIQGAAFVRSIIEPYGERPEQIAVDEIGVGAGVVDQLKGWYGSIVVGINSSIRMDGEKSKEDREMMNVGRQTETIYFNTRAMMWGEMKEWLAGASIPYDLDLKSELTSIRYGYRGGSILLESKDDMKKRGVKSPNKADAIALTFADPRVPEDHMGYSVFQDQHNLSRFGAGGASRAGY